MEEFLRGDTLYKMVIIHLIGYLLKKKSFDRICIPNYHVMTLIIIPLYNLIPYLN